jgi:hypothetical protein
MALKKHLLYGGKPLLTNGLTLAIEDLLETVWNLINIFFSILGETDHITKQAVLMELQL